MSLQIEMRQGSDARVTARDLRVEGQGAVILVVEDDAAMRLMMRRALTRGGHRVVEAGDGLEAINVFLSDEPTLVLLDAMMPVMDGFTFLDRMRQLPGGENVPVVMVTGLDDAVSVERAFSAGATDYIAKPVHLSVLSQRVSHLVKAATTAKALRVSEERYRLLFEGVSTGLAILEPIINGSNFPVDFRYLDVNPAFEEMTGLVRGDIVGRTQRDVIPGTESEWIQRFGDVAVTGQPAHFEISSNALGRSYRVSAFRTRPGQVICEFIACDDD